MGYNSTCVKDLRDYCVYQRVFGVGPWDAANQSLPPTDSRCHSNKIRNKMGYNLACVRDICEIFASIGEFSGLDQNRIHIQILVVFVHISDIVLAVCVRPPVLFGKIETSGTLNPMIR